MIDSKVVINLYNQGLTLERIGNYFGVSRQRVWQVIKNNYKRIDKVNRRTPPATSPHPRSEEIYVIKKLQRLGFKPIPANYNSSYDILLEDGRQIEVKYRTRKDNKSGSLYWAFNYLLGKIKPDFYIFICGKLGESKDFIVPGEIVESSTLNISVNPKNKNTKRFYKKYLNNWQIIKGS